jgi:hypothetical protein
LLIAMGDFFFTRAAAFLIILPVKEKARKKKEK